MVVFRSPMQRQRHAAGFSTSPVPSGAMDEDPESIFNATPGPARARSVDVGGSARHDSSHVKSSTSKINGIPGSAILQQRLAHSLMMVAESPSSKHNAPDPFKPRKQLRRSPPAGVRMLDHQPQEQSKQGDGHATTVEEHEEIAVEIAATSIPDAQPSPPSAKGKERERNFELAAKALFDTARPQHGPSHTKGRLSLPGTLQATQGFLTPQAASHHRRLPSLQEDEIHRSAPMRASTSNTSIVSAPAGNLVPSSPGSPGKTATPVKSLAKIGRLTARAANLETKLKSVTSELDAILQAHQELQEQYEYVNQEKIAAQERIAKFELIATECEDLIESHERLQLANRDLEEQRHNDIVELETVKEAMGKLKWRERKLRYELSIRREEGIYKEYELQNDQLNPVIRQLKLEKCQLQVAIADLQESISIMKYEKTSQDEANKKARQDLEWYAEVTKTHQEDLTTLQARLERRTRAIAELEEEQKGLLENLTEEQNERARLAQQLEEAQQTIASLEKQNASEKETHGELIANKIAVKRLEKEVQKLEGQLASRSSKLDKQLQDLQNQLDDKNTKLEQANILHQNLFKKSEDQLKQNQKDLRALEKKYELLQKERDQLKDSWDMHRRASRVFGDAPNQTTNAGPSAGTDLTALADNGGYVNGKAAAGSQQAGGKRKRGKGRAIRDDSQSEEEDEKPDEEEKAASLPSASVKSSAKLSSKPLPAKSITKKGANRQHPDSSDEEQEEGEETRAAKRSKAQTNGRPKADAKGRAKGETGKKVEESASDSGSEDAAPTHKEVKRERRRTAIKSGVPDQFRQKLKQEANDRQKKKEKKREPSPDAASESSKEDSSESTSESDTVFVQSSPNNSARSKATKPATKTPAQASQSNKRNAVVKEDANTSAKDANAASKSVPSAGSAGTTTTGKKKITLHKSASSQFIWGGSNASGVQRAGSKSLFDLPDILSPMVKR